MTKEDILQEIDTKGRYTHSPKRWDDETEESLAQLLEDGEIRQCSEKEMGMNGSYMYKRVAK